MRQFWMSSFGCILNPYKIYLFVCFFIYLCSNMFPKPKLKIWNCFIYSTCFFICIQRNLFMDLYISLGCLCSFCVIFVFNIFVHLFFLLTSFHKCFVCFPCAPRLSPNPPSFFYIYPYQPIMCVHIMWLVSCGSCMVLMMSSTLANRR